jgi:hypothetical protein
MRFIIHFSNGYWKIFDRQSWEDVAIIGTRADALTLLAKNFHQPRSHE